MEIKILNISEGHHFYEFTVGPKELGLDEEFNRDVRTTVNLEKTSDKVFIKVDISAQKVFVCDRCLVSFDKELKNSYSMIYMQENIVSENDDDSVTFIPKEQDIINISKDVKDFIMLSVPMKNVCKDDCIGICSKCGQDLNFKSCNCKDDKIDPRWEKLKDFKKN